MKSPLQNTNFLFAFGVSSLFVGAALIYISIKAPFFWGGAYLPGVLLVLVFAVTAVFALANVLRRPTRHNE
jgi:hypothetical protein